MFNHLGISLGVASSAVHQAGAKTSGSRSLRNRRQYRPAPGRRRIGLLADKDGTAAIPALQPPTPIWLPQGGNPRGPTRTAPRSAPGLRRPLKERAQFYSQAHPKWPPLQAENITTRAGLIKALAT